MLNADQEENNEKPKLVNISWQAFEFEKYEKGTSWFLTIGAIGLIIFAVALITQNYIFAIVIILAVLAIFIYAAKEPRQISFKIDGQGITIDNKSYPYNELKSFWIFYNPPSLKELCVKSKKWSSPLLRLPLDEQNPIEIREALLQFIPEEEQQQSLIDIIARQLKF